MIALRIATRVVREITRDRRTVAFIIVAPILVMALIYFALRADAVVDIAVLSRGTARLFEGDFKNVLENDPDVRLVTTSIPDELSDDEELERLIRNELRAGKVDGVILLGSHFVEDRFEGKRGTIQLFVEGSSPLISAAVIEALSDATDELAAALPVVIDASCSSDCANSVNNQAIEMDRRYIAGSDDLAAADYFLPLFPPFFAFFFTFVLAAISFQRERVRGTLDRVFASPASFLDVIMGYVAGFIVFATVQAAIILAFVFVLIEFPIANSQIAATGLCVLLVVVVALFTGLLVSFVAYSEFQALQFIPLIVLPQVFLSDMIWPLSTFPKALQAISLAMPLTYANRFSRDILIRNLPFTESLGNLAILLAFIIALVVCIRLAHIRLMASS